MGRNGSAGGTETPPADGGAGGSGKAGDRERGRKTGKESGDLPVYVVGCDEPVGFLGG